MSQAAGAIGTPRNQRKEAMNMCASRHEDERLSGLMWGVGLVLVGSVFLLQYLDVLPFRLWRAWWPLVLVMVGIAQMVGRPTAKGLGDGVGTILIGAWCFVATNGLFGLTWRTSWPLALVAAGTGMVVRAIAIGVMGRSDRHPRGCRCDACRGEGTPDA